MIRCAVCAVHLAFSCWCIAPGFTNEVTTERLTGARLVYIDNDVPIQWVFTETRFFVHSGLCLPIPLANELLAQLQLLKPGAFFVSGTWEFDQQRNQLRLHIDSVDGQHCTERVRLRLRGAGPVRADLGQLQYNLFPK